jgi:hypothetical protein
MRVLLVHVQPHPFFHSIALRPSQIESSATMLVDPDRGTMAKAFASQLMDGRVDQGGGCE